MLVLKISSHAWYPRGTASSQHTRIVLIWASVHSGPCVLMASRPPGRHPTKASMNGTSLYNIYQNNIFFSDLKRNPSKSKWNIHTKEEHFIIIIMLLSKAIINFKQVLPILFLLKTTYKQNCPLDVIMKEQSHMSAGAIMFFRCLL